MLDEAKPSAGAEYAPYLIEDPPLISDGTGHALDVDRDLVDLIEFERLMAGSANLGGGHPVQDLKQALGLWRGEAFAGVSGNGALDGPIRALEHKRSECRERLARAMLREGDASSTVIVAEGLLADEPLREAAWAILIEALAASHRFAEALRAYQRASDALIEAGLEPSEILRDAEALAITGTRSTAGTVAGPGPIRHFASSLVGRESELRQIAQLLDESRIVTLIGPGGVGKTRLAMEVARRLGEENPSLVRIIELARVQDHRAVPATVAETLGMMAGARSVSDALARAGELDAVVVLDNCEHLIEAAADVVERIVGGGGRARVLATSRERVGVDGERSWPINPLATGEASGPAVELFVDRVSNHLPSLVLDTTDRARVHRIVELLDGLPLAIEMAAARVPSLGLARLEAELMVRFDVLRNTRRLQGPRHRSLEAMIEWSENLLTDVQRQVLAELAVFAGPVGGDDIEAVLARPDVVTTVGELVDRSLVVAHHDRATTRYSLLEMIRRHGRRRLADPTPAELGARHARHFLQMATEADRGLRTDREADAGVRLDDCFAELRLAHAWGRENDPSLAMALSARLHLYASSRQRHEVFLWAADMLSNIDHSPDAAVVLASLAYHANDTGQLDDAHDHGNRSLAVALTDVDRRFGLETLADTAMYEGDLETAERLARELLRLSIRADDNHLAVISTVQMCLAQVYSGRHELALETIRSMDRNQLSPSDAAWLAYGEGEAILDRDRERALECLDRAVKLAEGVGHMFIVAVAGVSVVSLLGRTGSPDEALLRFSAVIDHWYQRGDNTHLLTTLRNLVVLFDRIGAHRQCAELLGAVSNSKGFPSFGEEAERMDRASERARQALGAGFERHHRTGSERDIPATARWAGSVIDRLIDGRTASTNRSGRLLRPTDETGPITGGQHGWPDPGSSG